MEELDFSLDDLKEINHVQKMKESFPDYPCTECHATCSQTGCTKWKNWFTKHWRIIRKNGLAIQNDRDIREGLLELRGIYKKEDLER